ncbi:uncharacterized protein LOC121736182 [Aricia agestis]|uniref:uncharacterized protein LOC121736182 n=1 Tax=Aricia agestis TaxID=91739 RepID=UPI001C2026AB|nr:uncharacterized protein LOC121736182 [Aricia agestis]
MESVKETLNSLSDTFYKTMDSFQTQLQKASESSKISSALPEEFNTFRTFIFSALSTIQQQVLYLGREAERQELYRRRKMLLFHGVPEEKSEDLCARAVDLISSKLKVPNFDSSCIRHCHRLGQPGKRPRPLLIKFSSKPVRDQVWFSKTKLKGSGITQSEYLTKTRHDVFTESRKRFGITKTWTRDGFIYILDNEGNRHRVENLNELDKIPNSGSAEPSTLKNQFPFDKTSLTRAKKLKK